MFKTNHTVNTVPHVARIPREAKNYAHINTASPRTKLCSLPEPWGILLPLWLTFYSIGGFKI